MLVDGISLIEGSNITNLVVASGAAFPTSPDAGELFYKTTSTIGLYVYTGSGWELAGSSLPSILAGGSYGGAASVPVLTVSNTGLVTAVASAAIQINETQITDGTLLARLTGNEIISGTWTFNNAVLGATPTLGSHLATKTYVDTTVGALGPTLSLGASQITSGTFADARISESSVTQHQAALTILESQITDGSLLARLGGSETITGSWQFNNPVVVPTPSAGSHATSKDYVDQAIAGLSWKSSVRVATTANIALTGLQTIDGVALSAGNRVLVKNQSTQSQNGVYVAAAGAWTRATDFDSIAPIDEINSAAIFVQQGSTLADTAWTQTLNVATVGTDSMSFTQFAGTNTFFAGTGMTLVGNAFNVNTASTARIVVNTDDIDLATVGTAGTYRSVTTDAYGRVTAGTNPTTLAGYGITDALLKTGDVMSGFFTVNYANPQVSVAAVASGQRAGIALSTGAAKRWEFVKSNEAESGSNAGSNFSLLRFDDAGLQIGQAALNITRSTGNITASGSITAAGFSGPLTGAASLNVLKAGDTMTGSLSISHPSGSSALFLTPSVTTNAAYINAITSVGDFYMGRDSSIGGLTGAASAAMLWATGSTAMLLATNSIERLRISSAGNVTVNAPASGTAMVVNANDNALGSTLTLRNTNTGASSWARLDLVSGVNAGLVMFQANSGNSSLQTIGAHTLSLGTDNTARMNINALGDVGIGTPSPTNYGAGYTSLAVNGSIGGIFDSFSGGARAASLFTTATEARLDAFVSRPWNFYTGAVQRMQIGATGNVSISAPTSGTTLALGVAAGQVVLNAASTSTGGAQVRFPYLLVGGAEGTAYPSIGYNFSPQASATNNYIGSDTASRITFQAGGFQLQTAPTGTAGAAITFTNAVAVTQTGNVGVGTSVPADKLHVRGTTTANQFLLNLTTDFVNAGTTSMGIGGFSNASGSAAAGTSLRAHHNHTVTSATDLSFWTSPAGGGGQAERMRILSDGSLIIGGTTRDFEGQLEVRVPSGVASVDVFAASAAEAKIQLLNNNNSSAIGCGTGGSLIFYGNTRVTERMRMDSSGNFGIGTVDLSTGSPRLAVNGSIRVEPGGSSIQTTSAGDLTINASNAAGQIAFRVAGAERARITAAGDMAIGTTSASRKLTVAGNAGIGILPTNQDGISTLSASSAGITLLDCYHNSVAQQFVVQVQPTGGASTAERLRVNAAGITVTGTVTETSTIRVKKNVRPIEGALEKVLGLQGVVYDMIDDSAHNQHGLIAEEVQQVLPNVVYRDEDGEVQGVQYARLVAVLIEGMKAQEVRIKALEAIIAQG